MPLLRTAMYAKNVEISCAPTVDERDVWQASMRHIAHEGRCFVISACQVQPTPRAWAWMCLGGTTIVRSSEGAALLSGRCGEILAGPLVGEPGLLVASIDTDELERARYDFDVVGHYARPDVFSLHVDERARRTVEFQS